MNVNLKTTAEDRNFDGICPDCKEHTTAGDSCCGRGAYVEGGLVSDESAQETVAFPRVCITLLKDVPHAKATALHHELFEAGVSVTLSSSHSPLKDLWTLRIFVELDQLPIRSEAK